MVNKLIGNIIHFIIMMILYILIDKIFKQDIQWGFNMFLAVCTVLLSNRLKTRT